MSGTVNVTIATAPLVTGTPPPPPIPPPTPYGNRMRTYGRVMDDPTGAKPWVEVGPDQNGYLDSIYLTALAQTLKLNLNESPFFGDWGIPARQAVATQVYPDYYVMLTQQRYATRFQWLTVSREPGITPVYDVGVQFEVGAQVSVTEAPLIQTDQFGQAVFDQNGNAVVIGKRTGRFAPI